MASRPSLVLPSTFEEMHHAYLLVGDPDATHVAFETLLAPHLVRAPQSHPDILFQTFGTFSIDDARVLCQRAYLKPSLQTHRIFYLYAWSLTEEAQNALLKLFEEPSHTARFFLCTPRSDVLLPTLSSRVEYLGRIDSEEEMRSFEHVPSPSVFISSSPGARLALVQEMISSKDIEQAHYFIREIEKKYAQNKGKTEHKAKAYRHLWDATRMLGNNNMSVKMVIEHLSMVLPVVQK